jgi:hypothetical protein
LPSSRWRLMGVSQKPEPAGRPAAGMTATRKQLGTNRFCDTVRYCWP